MKKMSHHEHERELHLLREELALTKKLLEDERNDAHRDREQLRLERENNKLLHELIAQLQQLLPHLASVKINFGGKMLGPVTLTVGDQKVGTLQGFDQNGAPFAIDPATVQSITWAVDNTTLDSSTPQPDNSTVIVSLAAGVANLTGTLTTTDGKTFSDTETITNVAQTPVLSSVKIDFA